MRAFLMFCAAVLLSAGCASDPIDAEPKQEQPPAETEAESEEQVASFWEDVPNGDNLRAFIDEDAAAANCEALQEFFDTWDVAEIDANVKADLLSYIDDALDGAGCYD